MTARTYDIDDLGLLSGRRGVGVRASTTSVLTYDLTVIAVDVADTVRAAGGWLCDRVRAGWDVTVYIPVGADPRPLAILGVTTETVASVGDAVRRSSPTALAMAAETLASDAGLMDMVRSTVDRGITEVTLWGRDATNLVGRVGQVRHRLSAAAAAFKSHALVAGSQPTEPVVLVEEFHSCALWYPPEGSDLMPVG